MIRPECDGPIEIHYKITHWNLSKYVPKSNINQIWKHDMSPKIQIKF